VSPTTALRGWFGHEPGSFGESVALHRGGLRAQRPRLAELRRMPRTGIRSRSSTLSVTEHNDAIVLGDASLGRGGAGDTTIVRDPR